MIVDRSKILNQMGIEAPGDLMGLRYQREINPASVQAVMEDFPLRSDANPPKTETV